MADTITPVNSVNFEKEVVNSHLPVLIDFFAEWCGPCKMIAPVLAQLADEYKGKLKIVKIDVDISPELAGKFSVSAMPTLIIAKGGSAIATQVGANPKAVLKAWIDRTI